ncbi:hypothetical protein JCM10049v2_006860 [Rhodotorula toruloides]
MDTQQSSPLLRLPVELLYVIFNEVYARRPLEGRLCRALLHLQDDLVKSKYRRVKLVGSQAVVQYAQTIEARYMLGRACESMTITSDEKRPHDELTDVDLEAFFANLPNLRRFSCDSTQLCVAFVSLLRSPGRTPFPQLEELDLSPPNSLSFPVNSLLKLSSLADLEIANYRPVSNAPDDVEDEEPILLPRLASINLDFLDGGDVRGIVPLLHRTCNLQSLTLTSFRPNEEYHALLKAAGDLGTINDLSLSGPGKKSWELTEHLRPFKHLTRLNVGRRCALLDAETVKFLRRRPLEYLRFGPGAILSANLLLDLVSGTTKHRHLKKLVLDNISARCNEFWSWENSVGQGSWCEQCDGYFCVCDEGYFEYMIFASDWLDYGYRVPRWTKAFSRQGCESLVAATKTGKIKLFGSAVAAVTLEDRIRKNQQSVEEFVKGLDAKRRRMWRDLGFAEP